jgi:DNA-binding transcriptional ArsR family regulator
MHLLASYGASCTAGDLARALERPVSHLSRHIQALQVAALIRVDRRGSWHDVSVSTEHPAVDSLCAAVLSMPDTTGVFASDLKRLLALSEGAEGHSGQPSASFGG